MRHIKSMKTYALAAVLFLTVESLQGQGLFAKKAQEHEDRYHYVDASDAYQGLFVRGSREASLQAARNLYKGRRYEDALKLYEHADSLGIITDADEVFRFFECLKSVKRYSDADKLVSSRIKDFSDRPEFGLHEEKLDFYNKLSSFKGVELTALGLNTKYSEISPTMYDGWLYFVSTRPSSGNWKIHRINMQPFYNLYAVPLDGDMKTVMSPVGAFGKPEGMIRLNGKQGKSLPDGINKRYHDGPIRVTENGNLLFFTTNHSDQKIPKDKKGKVNLRIFWSEKQGNVWSKPSEIPGNSFDYSNQHAYYDEGTSTLYFSSNRAGGKGGYDIWKMKRNGDGSWMEAENLGDKINTPKSEVFPSLTPDGQLLFASNGWPGLGGLDLFMVDSESKQPLNLLAGVNSEKDDFGLYFTGRNEGYLSSNREGTQGDDDIWRFKVEWDVQTVRRYNAASGEVKIAAKDASTKQGLSAGVKSVESGTSKVTASGTTGPDGSAFELTAGEELTVTAEGYEPVKVAVTEEMIRGGSYAPELKAIANYKEGSVSVVLRDKATGGALEGGFIQTNAGTTSEGEIPSSGGVIRMMAGSQLQLESEGYDPVTVLVTEELIKGARLDQTLDRSKESGKALTLMVTDAGTSSGIAAELGLLRGGVTTTRMISREGGTLRLLSGDRLTVSSAGYVSETLTLKKSDLKKTNLGIALKRASGTGDALAGGDGKPSSGDKLVQVRMLADRKFVIYFNFEKFNVRDDAAVILGKVAYILLEEYQQAEVLLTGHTDTRGTKGYNEQLSKKRVDAAKQWLIGKGIDAARIRTEYHGELKLAKLCDDELSREKNPDQCLTREEHQLNRRVEVEILNMIKND